MESENRFCSWCLKQGVVLAESAVLSRNIFKCKSCSEFVLSCRTCKVGLARHHEQSPDSFCFGCDGKVSWTAVAAGEFTLQHLEEATSIQGWCSWCFQHTTHQLKKDNHVVGRSIYQCTTLDCQRRTIKCIKCDALARGDSSYDDQLCLLCDGTILRWGDPDHCEEKIFLKDKWCSWCLEKCNHRLERTKVLQRHVYECTNCNMRTLFCAPCGEAMCRGGTGWDDDLCEICDLHNANKKSETWESFVEKRDLIYQQREIERVKAELERESDYSKNSFQQGIIRPFFLLVSMHPIIRNRVANYLGFSILTQPYFGDSHREAWEILHRPGQGMKWRCDASWEKLSSPLRLPTDWYYLLFRVYKKVFKGEEQPDLPPRDFTLKECQNSSSKLVQDLENNILFQLSQLKLKTQTNKQIQEEEELNQTPEMIQLQKTLQEATGISSTKVLAYSANVVNTTMILATKRTTVAMLVPALARVLPATMAASMTTAAAVLTTPLMILGLVSLASSTIQIALQSSEARLLGPVTLMIHQRMVLVAEGIKIEDYY
eukprot:Lithocolla_globosa_v1_NODE_3234_length_1726_cov_6.654099.p1 type:complete len:544 gc:universal NODE_3234_length_1726_cov_6.654099:1650-19(-)